MRAETRHPGWLGLLGLWLIGALAACTDGESLDGSPDGGGALPAVDGGDARPARDAGPTDARLDPQDAAALPPDARPRCAPGDRQPCGDLCVGERRCVDGAFGPCELPPERCNGNDDDCDGATDEGFEARGTACTAGVGACARAGVQVCTADGAGLVCDARPGPAAAEACNAVDDDCDGAVDEGADGPLAQACYGGPADTAGVGACAAGQQRCEGGAWTACTEVGPTEERCDGVDNDCDGAVDEADPLLGAPCSAGLGGCRAQGQTRCAAGALQCDAAPGASRPEVCGGDDEDCDGRVDEVAGVGDGCTVGQGQCARGGALTCTGAEGAPRCDARPGPPAIEICNGLDDDCDGATDELPGLGVPCEAGLGVCAAQGHTRCDPDAAQVVCDAVPAPPGVERCDGRDDDCDGVIDNLPGLGDACTAGVGACQRVGERRCGANGIALICSAVPGPAGVETCNGVDDDCDGRTDEGQAPPQGGEPCLAGVGACRRQGTLACLDGAIRCDATPGLPTLERCNGDDDDCDGVVDELPGTGLPCVAGQGACARVGLTACDPATARVECAAVAAPPTPERCNGVDDDCDGVIDPAPVCQRFASCRAARDAGFVTDGVYRLQPGPGLAVYEVWCDQQRDGGGWTLVASTADRPLVDARSGWYADLTTLAPAGNGAAVWDGLRALDARFDVRFACRDQQAPHGDPFVVDLSMYDTPWYTEWTTGSDADSCFSEGNGAGADPPPARRNNRSGAYLPAGQPWATSGYLEGEDFCSASEDFTVDFNDRGLDGNGSDGTDWGEADGVAKCGRAGVRSGQWFIFAREAGRLLRQGQFAVSDGPSWDGHRSLSCAAACDATLGDADWACSTSANVPNRRAFLDGWGDANTFCGPASEGAPERFAAPSEGALYDCGAPGCSYSAYVDDHGCDRINHCWRRVAALAFAPPAVGSTGTVGRLAGDSWRVCAAGQNTAWIAADRAGTYDPSDTCEALGYGEVDAWGGHCGQVCGQCAGGVRYDGVGGDADRLTGTVHWRCRR